MYFPKTNFIFFCFVVISGNAFSYRFVNDDEKLEFEERIRDIVVKQLQEDGGLLDRSYLQGESTNEDANKARADYEEDFGSRDDDDDDGNDGDFRKDDNDDKDKEADEKVNTTGSMKDDSSAAEKLCLNLVKGTSRLDYVRRVLSSLNRLIKHFEFYSGQLIADGLFGLRFAEGALGKLVKEIHKDNRMYGRLHAVSKRIEKLNAIAYHKTMARKEHYNLQFDRFLKEPFTMSWPIKTLKSLDHYIDDKDLQLDENFREDMSDHCITLLFGTAQDSNGRQCVVTKQCLELELKQKTTNYALTHQFLYFVAGLTNGCNTQFSKAMGSKQKVMINFERMAANIAYQMMNLHNKPPKSLSEFDVQVEQGLMCGLYGIVDCTKPALVEIFASHVNAKGCTTLHLNHKKNDKRSDKNLGGCSQHMDGLMTAYLSLSLRTALLLPTC